RGSTPTRLAAGAGVGSELVAHVATRDSSADVEDVATRAAARRLAFEAPHAGAVRPDACGCMSIIVKRAANRFVASYIGAGVAKRLHQCGLIPAEFVCGDGHVSSKSMSSVSCGSCRS